MKKLSTLILVALPFLTVFSQVGINTDAPQSTLHIAPTDADTPAITEGVIIPRVTSLNTSGPKANSLLVFLESSNSSERGFYYWLNDQWRPFTTTSTLQENRSVLIFRGLPQLIGGSYTLAAANTDTRTYGVETDNYLASSGNFAYVNNGNIIIQKAGFYDINAIITLQVNADGRSRRDSYEVSVRKNGTITTLQSSYGFPNSGDTYVLTNSIPVSGALQLAVGDILDIHINRFHKPDTISGTSGSQVTTVVPELSNITLRYLGT